MLGSPTLLSTRQAGSARLRGADAAKLKFSRELQLQHVRRARLRQQHLALCLGRPQLHANSPVLCKECIVFRRHSVCNHCCQHLGGAKGRGRASTLALSHL